MLITQQEGMQNFVQCLSHLMDIISILQNYNIFTLDSETWLMQCWFLLIDFNLDILLGWWDKAQ